MAHERITVGSSKLYNQLCTLSVVEWQVI